MSVARTTTFSLPSSHEGHGMGTGGVPSDLWPTLGHNCGESQDLGELLNPAGQAESLGASDDGRRAMQRVAEGRRFLQPREHFT